MFSVSVIEEFLFNFLAESSLLSRLRKNGAQEAGERWSNTGYFLFMTSKFKHLYDLGIN